MASTGVITLIDYDGEKSSFTWQGKDIDETNLVAENALIGAMTAAINAVSLGNYAARRFNIEDLTVSSAFAGSAFAQREIKWLVTMVGVTSGKTYQRTIPMADLALLEPNTEDMVVAGGRDVLDPAIENIFRGDGGELVTVQSVKFVGRNL